MADTIVKILQSRAKENANKNAYVFLHDDSKEIITYGELDRRACKVAQYLLSLDFQGKPVLILHAPGIDYIVSLFGCLYAGCIAIPAYPPRNSRQIPRIQSIIENSGAVGALLFKSLKRQIIESDIEKSFLCMDLEDAEAEPSNNAKLPDSLKDDIAILQYTSGSTGTPKGVVLTHQNIIHNSYHIKKEFNYSSQTVAASWLPPYHDMGMIGGILQPIYAGCECILMAHTSFIQRPLRWLEAISLYNVTITGAPNFAYELCVERIKDEHLENLNLHHWKVAYNGAEAVREETLQRFIKKFEKYGFNKNAFLPCYGLAEATLLVAGKHRENNDDLFSDFSGSAPVNCGESLTDQRIVIVDPATGVPCQEHQEGEIWISGLSVAQGYWNQPDLTEAVFKARLCNAAGEAEDNAYFLRTGDLGYLSHNHLYVTGRIKDVINLGGRKFYPHDIEFSSQQSYPELRAMAAAAFSIIDGQSKKEKLVLIQELPLRFKGDAAPLISSIRKCIMLEYEIIVDVIWLVKAGQVPRTSSGKVRRSQTKENYLSGTMEGIIKSDMNAEDGFEEKIESLPLMKHINHPHQITAFLQGELSKMLGLEISFISVDEPLNTLGMDSLSLGSLKLTIRKAFDVELPFTTLYTATLTQLASRIIEKSKCDHAAQPAIIHDKENQYEPFPLTGLQQAYWIGRQPDMPLGGVSTHFYIEFDSQNMDIDRLELAWKILLERHPMLSATLLEGFQQQIPRGSHKSYFIRQNLIPLSSDERAKILESTRQRMSHNVLPAEDHLYEIVVSILSKASIRIHLSVDLLIADAASFMILFKEWEQLYKKPEVTLPALPFSFRDYVLALNIQKTTESYATARNYWQQYSADLSPGPDLPLIKTPEEIKQTRFVRRQVKFSKAEWAQLKKRAAEWKVTPSILMFSIYSEIIGLWSETPAFTLTMTLFNRPEGAEMLMGDFTSTLLMSIDVTDNDSFSGRANSLQQQFLERFEYKEYDGICVQNEHARKHGRPERSMSAVVFTSALNDSVSTDWLGQAGYAISQTPQVWLDHQLFEQNNELVVVWDAVEALFSPEVLDEMFASYQTILKKLIENEGLEGHGREYLLPQPLLEMIEQANATDYPFSGRLLHEAFVAQAKQAPEHIAIIGPECCWNYGQVETLSRQLALTLIKEGAQPNELIAIVMEKGWEQIIAALAINRAGAAYMPVDAGLPAQRIKDLLTQGQCKIVITQPWLSERLSLPDQVSCFSVTSQTLTIFEDIRLPTVKESDLAYVIFTSGSTGIPKGVAIEHQGAVNTVEDINRRFAVNSKDRILALSSLVFDLSVYDIFGALSVGAGIVLPAESMIRDPEALLNFCYKTPVTIWNSVPILMQMLVEYAESSKKMLPAELRLIMMSGDWIPLMLPAQLKQSYPSAQIISLGGATEASIWSIIYPIQTINPDWKSIPYGKALTNQKMYVLDHNFYPRCVGVVGEIYIAGIGLARCYWKDEAITQQKFLTNPHNGERLYRTGDIGRYLPDGNIEFLGRIDSQVKLNGYRVELGEIEHVLEQHPQVAKAVANVYLNSENIKKLALYVVARDPALMTEKDGIKKLKSFLAEKLPAYMLPSCIVFIETIPLSSNGKLNRKALPAPGSKASIYAATYEAPQDAMEITITQLWQELLDIKKIGRHDNFFDLGGNSLMIVRMIERLNKQGLNASVSDIFMMPTVAALAQRSIQKQKHVIAVPANNISGDADYIKPDMLSLVSQTQQEIDSIVERVKGGAKNIEDIYPLTSLQEGVLFHHLLRNKGDTYVFPILLKIESDSRLNALLEAFQHVIERHDILRSAVIWEGLPKPVQVIYRHAPIKLKDQGFFDNDEAAVAELKKLARPEDLSIDITQAPLLHFYQARVKASYSYVLILMHHLIYDHISLEIILAEIGQIIAGNSENLLPPIPFRNFIPTLRCVQREKSEHFFKELLSDVQKPTWPWGLNSNRMYPEDIVTAHQPIDKKLAARIHKLARQHGVSPASLFHTMWALVLAQATGNTTVVFGTLLSGRMGGIPGIHQAVGMFLNTLPFKVDISKGTLGELVKHVHYRLAQLLEHEHASLSEAQRCSPINASKNPLFTSLLNYRYHHDPETQLTQFGIEFLEAHEWTNFPLSLSVNDNEKNHFSLEIQCDKSVDINDVNICIQHVLEKMVNALENQPACKGIELLVEAGENQGYFNTNKESKKLRYLKKKKNKVHYAVPCNLIETTIASTWENILKIERVGRYDDFFDLGGHSLLAIQSITQLQEELGVKIPLTMFFNASTVESLALSIQSTFTHLEVKPDLHYGFKSSENQLL